MQMIIHSYADDNTFVEKFKAFDVQAELTSMKDMENLLVEVKDWMDYNWLKINDAKTEFIF